LRVTPPVEKFIGDERAAHARWERSQTPQEIALRDAIKAEYEALSAKSAPVDLTHPYAAAETLCEGVNARLMVAAKAGMWTFKLMKSKALGDRLKRLHDEGQAAYLSLSFAKKERTFLVLRCKECIDDFTFPLKSA